ncbi:MAG: GumC family protein [Terriglobia bacterium]
MLEAGAEINKTLDEYLQLAVRRRWWLLLPTCVVALATIGVSLLLTDVYRSETVILVEHQKVPEHYVISNVSPELRNRLQTMTQQILSRTRLLRIIDELGLYADRKEDMVPEELVELMGRNIQVELLGADAQRDGLNAFKISFSAEDPRVAQQVTSRLTSLFIEENLKVREQQSLGTTNFLQAQLEEARKELQQQEARLREFKTRFLGELPEQHQGNLQVLGGLQMQLQNIGTALNRARERRVYLESLVAQYKSLAETEASSPPGAPTPRAISGAETELARLRRQRAELLGRYTPKHPDIRKIEEEIAQTEALLTQMKKEQETAVASTAEDNSADNPKDSPLTPGGSPMATVIAQVESQLKANRAEIDNLAGEEERLKGKVQTYERRLNLTPLREQQLSDVVRDYNLSKQNYGELLKKKMESELATSMEKRQQGEQFRILDPPSLPEKPYRPDRLRVNALGATLGLGLAVGLAFLVEVRDRSVHSEKEVSRFLPVPLVIGVPNLPTGIEQRQQWWRRIFEWAAGSTLVLIVVAGELFILWRG